MNNTQGDNTFLFETMPVPRAVFTMAVPTIIGQLIVLFYNMADTFFIGKTGNPYMVAGASLILPVFNIALSFAGLVGVGGGSLISRLLGKKQNDYARQVFSFSIWLGVFVSVVFSVCVLIFIRPLLWLLGAGEETFGFAKSYAMCVVVAGTLPTVLSNVLANLLRSTGDSKKAGFGITLGGLINIVLDPLVMFVIMPSGMEIIGAGIATVISNCISCLYFVFVIRKKEDSVLKLSAPSDMPSKVHIAEVLSVGVPASVVTLLFDLDYIVLDKLMSSYGNFAIAAVGIVLKAERLPLNVGIGICQGMVPVVAYNYAASNYKRMEATKHFAMGFGLCVAAVSICLYEFFAPEIMRIFIDDEMTVLYGTGFLKARVIATPFMFLCFFHVHMFNALGQGRYSLSLGMIRWLVFNIPMLFALNVIIGMQGLVWSQSIADIFTVIISVIVYRRYARKNNLQGTYIKI